TIGSVAQFIDRRRLEEYRQRPTIGTPIANTSVYILDRYLNTAPLGVGGELCIGGDGLARGYLNNPELTAEKFPAARGPSLSTPLYRTGDLARWSADGHIEFLGRIDHQVKIRGYRIEMGEIESCLLAHKNINEAVLSARQNKDGENYLSAYIVSGRTFDSGELREYLSQRLPDYMVPAYFVEMERIPVTPNGKVDRRALPEPHGETGVPYVAPRTQREEVLAAIWADVLRLEDRSPGIDDNFFQLGGHSLRATVVTARIHKEFNVRIPLLELFKNPTIRGIGVYIDGAEQEKYTRIEPVEKRDYYALSSAQKRLFILHQMEEGSTAYNMPRVIPLDIDIHRERLEQVLDTLIARHESLRTSFFLVNGEPVQRIHPHAVLDIKYHRSLIDISRFTRPFDLSLAPLLRVGLIQTAEGENVLLVDTHHIISDGISHRRLVSEFMILYNQAGTQLPPLRLQYKDYACWQNSDREREALKQQEAWWLERFEAEVPVLELPLDYPRPRVQSFEGGYIPFSIGEDQFRCLKETAAHVDATVYMTLTALFTILMSKLSGLEDIVVGTPVAGRNHADLQDIIGMFVNTLAMRNYPAGEKTFDDFLEEVKRMTLDAFENQGYQFEDLVDRVTVARDTGRNPVFDVLFLWRDLDDPGAPLPDAEDAERPYEKQSRHAVKFDITFSAAEEGERLTAGFEYCSRFFKPETIERFITYFRNIVSAVVENRHRRIAEIDIITEAEKRQILVDFNDTGDPYPGDKTIRQLFEEQAARTPHAVAVVHRSHRTHMSYLTYAQLNKKSNQLAGHLLERGVTPGGIVGLKVERSSEMIIGILGILKTGAAYVPLNPRAPDARNGYILRECGAGVLVTAPEIKECRGPAPATRPRRGTLLTQPAAGLAYVIFTSGSTGRPKGVPITHANLSPLLHWGYRHLGIGPKDRFIQNLSYYFDWSVWEIVMAITTGAGLYMVPDELLMDAGACISFINRNGITVLHVTPTQYQYYVAASEKPLSLKYLFIGAEKLSRELVRRSFDSVGEDCRVFNMYGPTECTIIASVLEIKRGDVEKFENLSSVPIGVPVGNTGLLVLDRHLNICPVNVVGELYIGGDCVSRGYLNNPELTAQTFNRSDKSYMSHVFYKTGDMARWLPDGTVEFLGRIDQQVKIRGFRIELGEIETQLLKHSSIGEAVVIDREDAQGGKYLIAYIVGALSETLPLKKYLSQTLPGYMIPSYFVQIEKIPLNPNGKLDRKALPEPEPVAVETVAAPSSEIEEQLAVLWSEVLGIPVGSVSVTADFFQSGGHSLKATMLTAKIHKVFHVKMPLTEIFQRPTIRESAQYIGASVTERFSGLKTVEKREYYPLSFAQKRLYILQQMELETTAYNLPRVMPLDMAVDKTLLEETFRKMIRRHESLRTSFIMVNEEPVQRIHEHVEFKIDDIIGSPRRGVETFDLSLAPLLRVGLVRLAEEKYIFMMDMHHIITDGISQGIFEREFMEFLANRALAPLPFQYKEYSCWQNSDARLQVLRQQELYWRERFSGELPVLDLPCDYSRPAVQSFEGSRKVYAIGNEETAALKTLAADEGVTVYMVLSAVINLLLARLSGREDIIIGTPTAGRSHADLQGIIGMFVNTLAMRNHPVGEKTVRAFLGEVKRHTLEAFENQDYPFEDLVEKVTVARDIARNPLFDVMFALQNLEDSSEPAQAQEPQAPVSGVESVESVESDESEIAKFDITFIAVEAGGQLVLTAEYCTRLFKADSIDRFMTSFMDIGAAMLENPDQRISEIEMLPEAEKRQILVDFNGTGDPYP
ncbi:MAG: amino acid adenylation domain-containing protein, partial [bacterium]|nr:amino acid adenylation domain-containing protein [bacterium]